MIKPVAELQLTRSSWVRREISYFDFDTGKNSYTQKITLDIDVSRVRECCKIQKLAHLYVPIYWRKKEPMYAMDCSSADGTTLRLLNREFNEEFSEWLFWFRCREIFESAPDTYSDSLKKFVHQGIRAKSDEVSSFQTPEDENDRITWAKLMKDATIRSLWKTILECHIIVVRIPKKIDGSIVKLSEMRDFDVTSKSKLNPFSPVVKLKCAHSAVRRTKLLVPKDIRILRCRGVEGEAGVSESPNSGTSASKQLVNGHPISMEVFGDGRWARRYSNTTRGSASWTFFLAPRRAELLVPGLVISAIALLSCLFWWHHNTVIGDLFAKSILFVLMLTMLPVLASILMSRTSASYICRKSTNRYVWYLTITASLWFTFTALPLSFHRDSPFRYMPGYLSTALIWLFDNPRVIWIALIGLLFSFFVTSCIVSGSFLASFILKSKKTMKRWAIEKLSEALEKAASESAEET